LAKTAPYILLFLLLLGIILLITTSSGSKEGRNFDERITLSRKDKIPYGTYVAYNSLRHLFPDATIYSNRREPGYWDSLSNFESNQTLIIIARQFHASQFEMKRIINFVENGNDVFISARYISTAADEVLGASSSSFDFSLVPGEALPDSLSISLEAPPFGSPGVYTYPGRKFNTYFTSIDTNTTEVVGRDDLGRPDFIRLRAGKGNLYVHTEPLAFSNYFLLHQNNIKYYERTMSLLNSGSRRVVWDEYYLARRPGKASSNLDNEPVPKKWLGVLFSYPAIRAALLTAIFAILLYALLEMRRKQRFIPVVSKPTNDSLDFVKTVGRLYYDKGDHRNLCRKMSGYFLEYVRNRYKLTTGALDEKFVERLQFKSGVPEAEIRQIISFIRYIEEAPPVTDAQLTQFHKQLESFYNKS
jgi:hypothetical protein